MFDYKKELAEELLLDMYGCMNADASTTKNDLYSHAYNVVYGRFLERPDTEEIRSRVMENWYLVLQATTWEYEKPDLYAWNGFRKLENVIEKYVLDGAIDMAWDMWEEEHEEETE